MNQTIGSQIRIFRKVHQISMRELARRVKMSPGNLSEIERDLIDPCFSIVQRIAKELHVTIDTLLSVHIELCPACDGRRYTIEGKSNGFYDLSIHIRKKPCDLCHGTGQVLMQEKGNEVIE